MYSRLSVFAAVAVGLMILAGLAAASPPVPPPEEGFNISTTVDVEMSAGDFTEVEAFTWTWVHDPVRVINFVDGANLDENHVGRPLFGSTLGFPGRDQYLGPYGRAAQIRYTEEMQSTDTSFFQFKRGFTADSHGAADTAGNNLSVEKNYGYVASEASLIANAENKERVGLSIVANGEALRRRPNGLGQGLLGQGLGDMPSLCPWAQDAEIPATNEFIAMGSDTAITSVMVSDTETSVAATRAPEMDHSISAVGIGMAQGLMKLSLMEGGDIYDPIAPVPVVPDLVSKTDYSEKSQAVGTIDKFTKGMHYHSTIPQWQMPEPWYQLQ